MPKTKLGLAICGSYCTFDKILPIAESLTDLFIIKRSLCIVEVQRLYEIHGSLEHVKVIG